MANSYLELRFIIPRRNGLCVIGRGGDNIKRLHMEYRAVINVSDSKSAEQILTIGGFDLFTLCSTLQDILERIDVWYSSNGLRSDREVSMMIDQNKMGFLTGRDDLQLNQIVEETQTQIDIFPQCCPLSTERVARIKGSPFAVGQCVFGVSRLIERSPPGDYYEAYNADNADPQRTSRYGGYSTPFDSTIPVKPQPVDWQLDLPVVHEQTRQVERPHESEETVVPADMDISAEEETIAPTESLLPFSMKLKIPHSLADVILGKRGSRLNQIMIESGAEITISDVYPGVEELTITISGKQPDEVDNAKLLMQMCVKHFCVRIE